MTDIRKSLETLADAIEAIANQPVPTPHINDRELSGNKINGGRITNFSSVGIKDEAKNFVLTVKDDGIHVDTAHIATVANTLKVKGSLDVDGEIFARKLHVDEVSADIRNERTTPLEFKSENGSVVGKGLLWTGGKYTKQLVMQGEPDRLWSTEHIDLHKDKEYRIGNETVINSSSLGTGIVNSNLKKIGTLEKLRVSGPVNIDDAVFYDPNTQRFSIGTEDASGMLTLDSWDHQFIVDPTEDKKWKVGTYTTSELQIVTDDTARIVIGSNGNIVVNNKTSFINKVGIGVKNFTEDADLTVAGAIRFQEKKFEVASAIPSAGTYRKGDIVWNSNPQPSGYIGWVCIREGSPGEWKPFAQISA